jgi:hypothetical protein
LSPDGKRYGYVGGNAVFVDGAKVADVKNVFRVEFDDSGKHSWFIDGVGEAKRLFVDGKPVDDLEIFGEPVFTPDGSRMAVTGTSAAGRVVRIDGKDVVQQRATKGFDSVFSPGGKRWGVIVHDGKKYTAVVDGTVHGPYDDVTSLMWSADGAHFFFTAEKKNQWRLVIDGKERGLYKQMSEPVLLSDGKIRVLGSDAKGIYERTEAP